MEPERSNSNGAASTQELLTCLDKFVHLMAAASWTDLEDSPKVRDLIRQLCEKAPDAARAFAKTILEYCPSNSTQEPGADNSNNREPMRPKRNSNRDPSYRPPRSARKQSSDSGGAQEENDQVNQQEHRDKQVVEVEESLTAGDKVDIVAAQAVEDASATLNMAKIQQQTPGPQFMSKTTPSASLPGNIALATPTKQVRAESSLPQTEEIHRAKIPTSLESVFSSPESLVISSPETASLIDMITEAVRIIYQFSKYTYTLPREIHLRILQTLRNPNQEAIEALNLNQWSDGSMWMHVLETGSTQNQKVTILNMLEYMGAWEWYDKQIKVSQLTIRTKKNKPVSHKGAATHVLNKMQGLQLSNSSQGRWITGIGRVPLITEGATEILQSNTGNSGITNQHKLNQRNRISMQLSRGQKLSTKLVRELGLGILFSPKIWEYTKMSSQQLDTLIRDIQADSERMKLLKILGPQLETLIDNGLPDLQCLYNALRKEKLVSQEELHALRLVYGLDSDTIPLNTLETAVDGLIQDVCKILGKRKLEDTDGITVNNAIELSPTIFDKLHGGRWFNDELILAAMDISDKAFFVRHRLSIALDSHGTQKSPHPIERPLAAWAKKITELRQEARDKFGDTISLVYFCPLNAKNQHFTLLEINDREKVIRHYDSMVDEDIKKGSSRLTRVGKLIQEEFGDLGYEYREAPTPQQNDGWSCGVRVVWCFRRLANNLPIGTWSTSVCSRRMKMEIVDSFRACVESNVIKKVKRQSSEPSSASGNQPEKTRDDFEIIV